jgi:mono/diheme cytochrome c family protein
MRFKIITIATICACCFLFYECNNPAGNTTAAGDSSASGNNTYGGVYASQTEWGRHLITVGGCGDCHTPKKMTAQGPVDDSSLLLSGHPAQSPVASISAAELAKGIAATSDLTAWVGPWGTSYSANLTPDSTGIGAWTEEQFITCIRQGLSKGLVGSRPLMPPMPWPSYRHMSDDELKAVFAFLKTIPAVHNVVPQYQPPAGAMK